MTSRRTETFPPVTLGHIRGHGCRGLLVYCESIWCNHSAEINANWLPDDSFAGALAFRLSLRLSLVKRSRGPLAHLV